MATSRGLSRPSTSVSVGTGAGASPSGREDAASFRRARPPPSRRWEERPPPPAARAQTPGGHRSQPLGSSGPARGPGASSHVCFPLYPPREARDGFKETAAWRLFQAVLYSCFHALFRRYSTLPPLLLAFSGVFKIVLLRELFLWGCSRGRNLPGTRTLEVGADKVEAVQNQGGGKGWIWMSGLSFPQIESLLRH